MLEKEISRRNFVRFSVLGAGATAALAAAAPAQSAFADNMPQGDAYPNQLKIVHLSDTHFFSKRLWSDCPDFTLAENSDRKMFKESGAIIDKALAETVAFQPDLVIFSGDLTKDGELVCHRELHEKVVAARKELESAGKNTLFCVINGNHDINNDDNGRDFSSGVAEHTDLLDPLAFKDLWADCGYDAAVAKFDEGGSRGGSLSYVVRPAKGITLIAVDSCKYSSDQNGLGRDEHVTSGVVGDALLSWVEDQARQARAAGDIVIAMQHHGVVPHFDMEPELMGEYLVDNYEECQRRYADAGISAVFTGHMHANDIARIETAAGNVLYDIETCATVTYPSDVRFATLSWEREANSDQVNATLALDNHPLGSVSYSDFATGAVSHIADITEYGNERLLTVDVVKTMVVDSLVSPLLDQAAAQGGIRPVVAGLLGSMGVEGVTSENLDPSLFAMLAQALPQSKDSALCLDLGSLSALIKGYGTLGIWTDAAASRIVLERMDAMPAAAQVLDLEPTEETVRQIERALEFEPVPMAVGQYWSYYIDAASFAAFMAPIYTKIDAEFLQGGKPDVLALLRSMIEKLVNQLVAPSGETLFDLIKTAYGLHLYGDESCPAWAEAATEAILRTGQDAEGNAVADGSLISYLRAAINDSENLAALTALLKKVPLKVTTLCVKGEGSGPISLIGLVASNLGAVLGFLGDAPANMIPNFPSVAELAHGALYTLTHDTNEASDRKGRVEAKLTDPDWRPAPGPEQGQGGSGNPGGGSVVNPGGGSNNQGGSSSTGNGGPGKPATGVTSTERLPQTGDSRSFLGMAVMGVAALAGAFKASRMPDPTVMGELDPED